SIAGFIMVSWAARAIGHSSPLNSLIRIAAPASAMAARPLPGDDLDQLVDSAVEVVVHHHVVGDGLADRLLLLSLAQARRHLVGGITPDLEPALLLLPRRGEYEDEQSVGEPAAHLLSAVDLDLEDDIGAGRGGGRGGAVVAAEEVGPLEEAASSDALLEGVAAGEDVGVVRLSGPLGSGGPRSAEPQGRVARLHPPHHPTFAH